MDDQAPPTPPTQSTKNGSRKKKRLTASKSQYVAAVYERTLKPLKGYCVHVTGNSADGEDLTHDSYVNFMRRVRQKGKVKKDTEVAFLKKVAINEKRKAWSKNKMKATHSIDQENVGLGLAQKQANDSLNEFAAAERESSRLDKLKEFLPIIQKRLSEVEFTVILSRFGYGLEYEDIGKEVGLSPDEVKYCVIRAMAKIRYWKGEFLKKNCP